MNKEGERMKNCKIMVTIQMRDCEDVESETPLVGSHGQVEFVLNGSDAGNIDRCEQALLETVHPAVREALGQHLSAWSKKST
jgi:hypothetical protein